MRTGSKPRPWPDWAYCCLPVPDPSSVLGLPRGRLVHFLAKLSRQPSPQLSPKHGEGTDVKGSHLPYGADLPRISVSLSGFRIL